MAGKQQSFQDGTKGAVGTPNFRPLVCEALLGVRIQLRKKQTEADILKNGRGTCLK